MLNYNKLVFAVKINILETIDFKDIQKKELIISLLRTLNKKRNMLAHEFHFNSQIAELEQWSKIVFENFQGEKFSKYTYRTKIVHSFSILSFNLLELTN